MLEQSLTPTLWPELEPLHKQAKLITLERGELLYTEGDLLEHFHVLKSGRLRTYKIAPDGRRELTLERIRSGSPVLNAGFFLEPARAAFSCAALEPSQILVLPRRSVLECVKHSPELSGKLLTTLAQQQSHLLIQLERWQFWDLGARLGAYLLEEDRVEGQELPTNSELAALLGTVPELVSRKLGEFYRAGHIRLERRKLWIVNSAALEG